jgi:glycosyltransferase involved in cell wall biosynthesis
MPKVSFVVPTKNRMEWIGECVSSLLSQSEKDIEVIVVDDGSTDGTGEMLLEWLKNEPRFVYVKNNESIGAGPSRNRGTALAKSEIIGVCDDDDCYSTSRAERMIKFFDGKEGVMLNTPYLAIDYCDRPTEKFLGEKFDEDLYKKNGGINYFCHPSSAYLKKDFDDVGGYKKETDQVTDDYQFVQDWISKGKKIGFDGEEFVCFHRVLPDSMMSKHRGYKSEWNNPNGEMK